MFLYIIDIEAISDFSKTYTTKVLQTNICTDIMECSLGDTIFARSDPLKIFKKTNINFSNVCCSLEVDKRSKQNQ